MNTIVMRGAPYTNLHQFTLKEYREALASEGPPTYGQIENFAHYVANAHSWYKHLPAFPPGAPFSFFLDPGAGYDTRLDGNGVVSFHARTAPRGFHYNYRTTVVWRRDFGAFNFKCNRGTSFIVGGTGEMTSRPYDGPVILHPEFGPCQLPAEIETAGSTTLTAAMHEEAILCYLPWPLQPHDGPVEHLQPLSYDCPEEYGGNAVRDEFANAKFDWRPEILEPARRSQYARMEAALRAVLELTFPEAAQGQPK